MTILAMHPISPSLQETITSLLLSGHSVRQVVKKTNVGNSTIGRISKKALPKGENIKTGRPSKLSPQDKRRIVHKIQSGQLENAQQAAEFINSVNPNPVSAQTVRRALREAGMKAVVKKKVPKLSWAHRRAHLHFAYKHRHWQPDDWKMVLFSDETKIQLIGSDGCIWAWTKPGEGRRRATYA